MVVVWVGLGWSGFGSESFGVCFVVVVVWCLMVWMEVDGGGNVLAGYGFEMGMRRRIRWEEGTGCVLECGGVTGNRRWRPRMCAEMRRRSRW